MKYEKPNMLVVLLNDESIITTSPSVPLLPGTDINDGIIDGND